jgi:tetratricopeptide (TPR) repeat protein
MIIALNPQYAPAYSIRGWALEKSEDWTRALADYRKAVALGSDEAADHANCGRVRVHQGDFEGAIEDYTRAIQRGAADAVLFTERAKAYLALKKYSLGLDDFKSAIQRNPSLKGSLEPLMTECEAALLPK